MGAVNIGIASNVGVDFTAGIRALARTSDGNLHTLATCSTGLYYCKSINSGSSWSVTLLATQSVYNRVGAPRHQSGATIAVDSQDNLHVTFVNAPGPSFNQNDLHYIKYTKSLGTWGTDTILVTGANYDAVSCAIDGNDLLHIVYSKNSLPDGPAPNGLFYSNYNGSAVSSPVTLSSSRSQVPNIVVDTSNDLHVGWLNSSTYSYVKRTSGTWGSTTGLVGYDGVYIRSSLAVSPNGDVHFVTAIRQGDYSGVTQVRYFKYTSGAWGAQQTLTSDAVNEYYSPSINVDANGNIYIIAVHDNGVIHDVALFQSATGASWTESVAYTNTTLQNLPLGSSLLGALWPKVQGVKTDLMAAGYVFVFLHTNEGSNITFWYFSDSSSVFPTVPTISTMYNVGTSGKVSVAPNIGTTVRPIIDFTAVTSTDKTFTFQNNSATVTLQSQNPFTASGYYPSTDANALLTTTQTEGLLRYNTTTHQFEYYNGSAFVAVLTGATAIGATVTSGTTGSVLFVGAGPVLAQNNAKFFWDNTNFFLGIGTATPTAALHVGAGSHTGGATSSIVTEGQFLIGAAGNNFTTDQPFKIFLNPATAVGGYFAMTGSLAAITVAGGVTLFDVRVTTGMTGISSGTASFTGFNFLATQNFSPNGVTTTEVAAGIFDLRPISGAQGLIQKYTGIRVVTRGHLGNIGTFISGCGITNLSPNVTGTGFLALTIGQEIYSTTAGRIQGGTTIQSITDDNNLVMSLNATATVASAQLGFQNYSTSIVGYELQINNAQQSVTDMWGIRMLNTGNATRNVTRFAAIEMTAAVANSASVANWSLWKHTLTNSLSTTVYLIDFTSTNQSRHNGNFTIGASTAPTAKLLLGAGTTAANTGPLQFTTGSPETSARAGLMEFQTDDYFLTRTTGPTRATVRTLTYRGITALRTLDGSDELINATANSFTVTLPTAVGYTNQYVVKNSGTGVITLATTSSQTIDGQASGTISLFQYDSIVLRSDGANWIVT